MHKGHDNKGHDNILIFGPNGMLGRYVFSVLSEHNSNVHAINRSIFDILEDSW